MSIKWDEYCFIVTGAGGGIGSALCTGLAQKNAALVLCDLNQDSLTALKASLPAASSCQTVCGDITQQSVREELANEIRRSDRPCMALINNAGINKFGFFDHLSTEQVSATLNVGLMAPILLTHTLMPILKAAQSARIINIGSTFGAIGFPGFSAYSATKFGLRGFSQALGRELAGGTVHVQNFAPRATKTKFNSRELDALNAELGINADSPVWVAEQCLKFIASGSSEKFVGWPEKLFARINGVLPALVSKSLRGKQKVIHKHSQSTIQPQEVASP